MSKLAIIVNNGRTFKSDQLGGYDKNEKKTVGVFLSTHSQQKLLIQYIKCHISSALLLIIMLSSPSLIIQTPHTHTHTQHPSHPPLLNPLRTTRPFLTICGIINVNKVNPIIDFRAGRRRSRRALYSCTILWIRHRFSLHIDTQFRILAKKKKNTSCNSLWLLSGAKDGLWRSQTGIETDKLQS